jgi:hypothetical protein
MRFNRYRSAVLAVLLALVPLTAYGQVSAAGSLVGTVVDPSGAVIAGATVTVKDNGTGAEFKATTSENGTFSVRRSRRVSTR